MSLRQKHEYSWLLRISAYCLKGYGYFLFGLTITCLLATILGLFPIVQSVLAIAGAWILRILGTLVALTAAGVVFESVRN